MRKGIHEQDIRRHALSWAVLLLGSMAGTAHAQAPTAPSQGLRQQGEQQERLQQERESAQRRQLQAEPKAPPPPALEPLKPWPEVEARCLPIHEVALTGDSSGSFQWALDGLIAGHDPAIGRCLGIEGVNVAAGRAQQALMERGYQQQNGTLTLPGTGGQPGGAQQLFYADAAQKNQAWINLGLADPAITGLIVRTPIKPQTNPDALDLSRDRLTGRPLDDKGRYTVRVDVGNPIDGYEAYTPKYFSCATAECVRSGQNLDMSDPETQAYVKAIDAQVFKDIGKGITLASLAFPGGAVGGALFVTGSFTSLGSALTDSSFVDEAGKFIVQNGAETFFREVLGHTPSAAARAASLVDLAGGWDAFVQRAKREF